MTSIASSKGDVGAEMLSSQIGAYFDQAIRIIEFHGGDVVKFLGDALLVVFQAEPVVENIVANAGVSITIKHSDSSVLPDEDPAAVLRRNKLTVRRAVECGQELLSRLSNYRIYLSEREFARKLSSSSTQSEESENHHHANDASGRHHPLVPANNNSHGNTAETQHGPGLHLPKLGINKNAANSSSNLSANASSIRRSSVGSSGSSDNVVTSRRASVNSAPGLSVSPFNNSASNTPSHSTHNLSTTHLSTSHHPLEITTFAPRFMVAGTGPGLGGFPLAPVTTSPAPPGGVTNFRKREESVNSLGSQSTSTSSKQNKAGRFFNNAKSLFIHTNVHDRPGVVPVDNATDDSHDLQLHMALSAGDICKPYQICFCATATFLEETERLFRRLEYAICGEQMAALDDALNIARAGEVTVTKSAWKYVNADSYPWSESRKGCFILRNPPSSRPIPDLPMLRRVRNDRLLSAAVESNPHYYKYINKSAIHRLILYPDNTFPAQFRNATILFVCLEDLKPWTDEGLVVCQKTILAVHKVMTLYEGFIQQFAVDDKGATVLCAFGLPFPCSHEKEAIFAAKAAWLIRQRLLEERIPGFKISLATGVIFTSTIGNEFRRDPAIVGDTIVVAVRILKFDYAKESIVCDNATMEACTSEHKGLCEFEDMGEEFVKGKIQPLRIWRLVHFGARQHIRRSPNLKLDETIGYEPERERVSHFISNWATDPSFNTLLIQGPRGSGKCMFFQQICNIADTKGYQLCSAASLEVEKKTEYYPCKFLLLGLFDILRRHDIPYASSSWSRAVHPMLLEPDLSRSSSFGSNYGHAPSRTTTRSGPRSSDSSMRMTRRSSTSEYPMSSESPMISQYHDMSSRHSTAMTRLEAYITVCMAKTGYGNSRLVGILNKIISCISSDNSAPMLTTEEDSILADFVVLVLNYASQFVKIVVVFEDIQWCDFKSLNMIRTIHQRCPAILVTLFSRPPRDYGGGSFLKMIMDHPRHLEIALEGLKRREIEINLLRAFKENGVTVINPGVIDLVEQKTKGNPKLVKDIIQTLKEFYHVNIVDGELVATGQETTPLAIANNSEELLLKQDRKKMRMMQYDRLKANFQDFLKIASCLGDQFSLAEVAAIRPMSVLLGKPEPGRSYAAMICELDTYRFLAMATEQQAGIQFSDNVALHTIYEFASQPTANDIYGSIPYEERVGIHHKMAQFYESFVCKDTLEDPMGQPLDCQDLLPKITRHYLKTDQTQKKIKYLKILSEYELKSNMLMDTTQNLTELIDILDKERGARGLVSQADMADIYGMKGESLSKRMRVDEAEASLLDSLAWYGIHWPTTHHQWTTELLRERVKFLFNYHRGASPVRAHPGKVVHPKMDKKTRIRLERIVRVFSCLQNIYFWRTQPDAAMLSSLYTLSYSRRLGLPSGDQTASLGRIALLEYFSGKKSKCAKYMADARRAEKEGEATEGMLPAMNAFVEYSEGRHAVAHRMLDNAILESKSFGVVSNLATFYRAVTIKTAYRMWEGTLSNHPEDCQLLRTLSAVAVQNGDSEGETLFAIPTLANLLLHNRLREAESWVMLIEKYIMPKARLMNILIVNAVLAFYYAKMVNYEKSRIFLQLWAERIGEQGVGAHPFPMMSCMFTLMAMYEMYDSTRPANPVIGVDAALIPLSPEPYEGILNRVISYLRTDPFKVLSETYTCLAEAMKCFLYPGREKEGAQRLVQGYREQGAALGGINFVKAYMLTQLGRHSEVEDKDECYRQAYTLFVEMSMDPHVWLTDPSPGWMPPMPKGSMRYSDYIIGEIPLPTHTPEEGTLAWAAKQQATTALAI
ncbi:hypothetical protein BGW38_010801 [Lunasporangiospora selenospora]|uniref:Guanylate cyclase domain-containing protein n=1 Tax=Lunasporangiospora selenospora TaxID=979761 RepID=A0A9P6FY07_9FUNG|nr:hypothetical protein BGW38_010801 [Lunasporangiospora selenospora]